MRRLWGPAQAHRLLKVTGMHRSGCQMQHKKAMEDNKPWALISELHGPKIQAMFVWNAFPEAEPALLGSLPSLKVVANGGVGIDHLDVPYINSLGVKVTNTPDVVTDATADMALGLLLASARKIVEGESVEDEQALGASYCENMDDLLKESDFVVLAVNLTLKPQA
ncbi:Glyoxylate reductase/hydroxypyruvate reductase [Larimichthys crocea]|uniref:Glyoxylate reductase/hydroxypyruvate reductase n=1 Tax=Larimichthys crocea TaxID=215358 RepID=A0A6G0HS77_LARCR|nr:Glyoxylate reductase/hydroxypyruvate reductase [Larimichthys crocea]